MGTYGIACKTQDWVGFLENVNNELFTHVELNIYDVSEDSVIYNNKYLDDVKKVSKARNLILSVHALDGINLAEKIDRIRQASIDIVADSLVVAEYINAKWVTVHMGTTGFSYLHKEKKKKRLDIAISAIKDAIGQSKTKNVIVAIENLYKHAPEQEKCKVGCDIQEIKYVLNYLTGRVAFIFDLGHTNLFCDDIQIVNEYINSLGEYIVGSHIHFNNGKEDSHESISIYDEKVKYYIKHLYTLFEQKKPLIFESYSLEENMSSRQYIEKNFKYKMEDDEKII